MDNAEWLAGEFEANRERLRGVAFRMVGSLSEAEDAVQEAWLRLSRHGDEAIENLNGWLTTVVGRVCLDMLRARNSRREDALEQEPVKRGLRANPEQETVLADSVGVALLVVLERLTPAERLAFVLHDMFDVSFDEIGRIVGRTPAAARQLASRARRRVRGGPRPRVGLPQQRHVVDAFLAALRTGDFAALVAVLDPEVEVRADATAATPGLPREVRGAEFWAQQAIRFAQGARVARVALVDGAAGVVIAPRGRLFRVLRFTLKDGKIAQIEVIGDPAALAALDLAVAEN